MFIQHAAKARLSGETTKRSFHQRLNAAVVAWQLLRCCAAASREKSFPQPGLLFHQCPARSEGRKTGQFRLTPEAFCCRCCDEITAARQRLTPFNLAGSEMGVRDNAPCPSSPARQRKVRALQPPALSLVPTSIDDPYRYVHQLSLNRRVPQSARRSRHKPAGSSLLQRFRWATAPLSQQAIALAIITPGGVVLLTNVVTALSRALFTHSRNTFSIPVHAARILTIYES